jgi:hypothetical protein
MTMTLSIGQRVTLLRIDDCLALSHRYELEVRRPLDPTPAGWDKRATRLAIVRQKGKRKEFYLDLAAGDILLTGWALPFQTDTEAYSTTPGAVMSGNACYNLIGDPEAIRRCIETQAAIPIRDDAKAKIIVTRTARTTCDTAGQSLLYPEIDTHHAVINRLKDSAEVS